jgi:hypothetical protein
VKEPVEYLCLPLAVKGGDKEGVGAGMPQKGYGARRKTDPLKLIEKQGAAMSLYEVQKLLFHVSSLN